MPSRSRRGGDSRATARAPSAESNLSSVRVSSTAKRLKKSKGVTDHRDRSESHDVIHSRRPTRGPKKRYIESESSDDDDEEEEDEEEEQKDEIRVGASDVEMDAEGEAEDMDIDAEGDADDLRDEDAEGDVDMDSIPAITVSKPLTPGSTKAKAEVAAAKAKPAINKRVSAASGSGRKRGRANDDEDEEEEEEEEDDDDDDEELSESESVPEGEINDSVEVAGDEDAEGEDDDEGNVEGETEMVAGDDEEDAEGDEDDEDENDEDDDDDDDDDQQDAEGESDGEDGDGSRDGTPDLTKMTRRQRARFEETPQEYMKLSDEVQVKKVFTAEELSMRRQEMARRRRNLSDKRNEEVKAETINKLLKRQAPKTTKKNAQADDEEGAADGSGRSAAMFIRWTSNKQGNRVGVKNEVLDGPVGALFGPPPAGSRAVPQKMVEEVS
ncbi:hypothetical protein HMPREF1624_08674 [Sporothrix schenckii ATCC 58251]|uniref:INO80 complex subunit B-like conserved region domain-containing protein n=1 Tax=Sporothrix schenckii (strain ATCC 58251 / de Perez 2211183) TaxID=1391915 RepID=U7PHH0_SPOS1|nr:hypothetical protein HMPREF1624_08674 [Sporothrix schenckii ATCC 58251]